MRSNKTRTMARLALMAAIIAVMAFTPLGYLKTGGLSITLLHIPVILGAMWFGPGAGMFLGAVFGLTSFLQCFGLEAFGTALFGISPALTAVLCFLPRILLGLIAGLLGRAVAARGGGRWPGWAAAGFLSALSHTALFMGMLALFFYRSAYIQSFVTLLGAKSVLGFIILFVGINGAVELALATVLTAAVGLPVRRALDRRG